jgi:hypothetical protein
MRHGWISRRILKCRLTAGSGPVRPRYRAGSAQGGNSDNPSRRYPVPSTQMRSSDVACARFGGGFGQHCGSVCVSVVGSEQTLAA